MKAILSLFQLFCTIIRPTTIISLLIPLFLINLLVPQPALASLAWHNQTPAGGPWQDIRYEAALGEHWYFSLWDTSSNFYFYEFDGDTWADYTPANGPWSQITYVTEVEGKLYFLLTDASSDLYLYEFDGFGWNEHIVCGGPWGVREVIELGGKWYITLEDSSYNSYLYEFDGSNWTDRTPAGGTWGSIDYQTELDGTWYFRLGDEIYSNYQLYAFDGSDWSEQTPAGGPWQYIWYIATLNNDAFFIVSKGGNSYLYEFNGLDWEDQTPSGGPWTGIYHVTTVNEKLYVRTVNSSSIDRLFEFDGNSWSDRSPSGGPWDNIEYEAEVAGKWYFSFFDSSISYFYEFDGNDWTDSAPFGATYVGYVFDLNGESFFHLVDDSSNRFLYAFDGDNWAEQIQGDFAGESTVIPFGENWYVNPFFPAFLFYGSLYEFNGNSWEKLEPNGGPWQIMYVNRRDERLYFKLLDETGYIYLYALESITPDLTVNKTNTVNGTLDVGNSFAWKVAITNTGVITAPFNSGQIIFTDNLSDNASYGMPTVQNTNNITNSEAIDCNLTNNDLICSASGNDVIFGELGGKFEITIPVTATSIGTLESPRAGGICQVDPANVISEISGDNNICADIVTVKDHSISCYLPLIMK